MNTSNTSGSATGNFENIPVKNWGLREHQDYYAALETTFGLDCTIARASARAQEYMLSPVKVLTMNDALGLKGDAMKVEFRGGGWGKMMSPNGDFQGFWMCVQQDKVNECVFYLQIHNSDKLFICFESMVEDQLNQKLHDAVLEKVGDCPPPYPKTGIAKCRLLAGGGTYIAEIFFGDKEKDSALNYMALNADHTIDLPTTVERLKAAMKLVEVACK